MTNKNYLFQEIFLKNPVLIGTIGLCPVVAICTSLKSALFMSVVTMLTLLIAQILSSLVFKHLPQWFRLGLYMLVGMLVILPFMFIVDRFDPETALAFGIYMPLLAVNPLIVRQCEREGVNITVKEAIKNSLCAGLGYSLVLFIVGFVRELLGSGTIAGFEVYSIAPAKGFLMPMGGFVILAVLAGFLRAYFRRVDPEYAEELAVNSRTAIKGKKGLKYLLLPNEEYVEEKNELDEEIIEALENENEAEEIIEEPIIEESSEEDLENPEESETSEKTEEIEEIVQENIEDKEEERAKAKKLKAEEKAKKAEERAKARALRAEEKAKARAEAKAEREKADAEAEAELKAALKAEAEPKKKSKYEFITMELPSSKDKKNQPKEKVFAAPLTEEEAKAETTIDRPKEGSNIVHRSDKLNDLMSTSIDDLIEETKQPKEGEDK